MEKKKRLLRCSRLWQIMQPWRKERDNNMRDGYQDSRPGSPERFICRTWHSRILRVLRHSWHVHLEAWRPWHPRRAPWRAPATGKHRTAKVASSPSGWTPETPANVRVRICETSLETWRGGDASVLSSVSASSRKSEHNEKREKAPGSRTASANARQRRSHTATSPLHLKTNSAHGCEEGPGRFFQNWLLVLRGPVKIGEASVHAPASRQ